MKLFLPGARLCDMHLGYRCVWPLGLFAVMGVLAGCGSPASGIHLTTTSYDFGAVVVSSPATRTLVTVTNTGSDLATVSEKVTGDPSIVLRPDLSCGLSLGPGGSCSIAATFLPTKPGNVTGSLQVTLTGQKGAHSQNVALTGKGVEITAGNSLVTKTSNPVVALYNYQPEQAGTVVVEFGTDTTYGQTTASYPTPANLGPMPILVAGMKQNTTYHMRAVLTATDGTVTDDADQTFTTGSFPAGMLPTISVTTSGTKPPQPGIELIDAALSFKNHNFLEAYATDLSGNIIWGYNFADRPSPDTIIQPIKLMPNGNFLVVISYPQQAAVPGQGIKLDAAMQSVDLMREIDLAGNPVAQITLATLNQKLTAAGYDLTLNDIHHDVAMLPNGHLILIASTFQSFTDLPGYPGTTNVLGDVLVDLDRNFNVDWVWNEFDHLDVNRHPMNFPDWTHTNAVIYSPDDGNLLVSMRHQSWIVKVDYENGKGNGDILWRLGYQGDFTLVGGTAPQDWFYGQHAPSFATPATAGQFSLAVMDNGYNRIMADGSTCGSSSSNACYTTVPIIAINEAAKTATITFRKTLPPSQYSEWGGNAEVLPNGDLEYDLCSDPLGGGSEVDEITVGSNSQAVWTMKETGANLYRAERIPSLYPGVQW